MAEAGDGTGPELMLAPKFHIMLERVLGDEFATPPRILPEYKRAGIGRPDLALARPGQPARAFIELKARTTRLEPQSLRGHDKAQFKRFGELPIWGYCNFHSIHLYRYDRLEAEAIILPAIALAPETDDAKAARLIGRHDVRPFLDILALLVEAQPVPPENAAQVAALLARAARLVRAVVLDSSQAGTPPALAAVRTEFRETLFAHAARGGYDESDENRLFAGAFAQTLAFGLLLAREAGAPSTDERADRYLPEGSYPLLRATLRALLQDEIVATLGVAFDVLRDSIDCINQDLLVPRRGVDPILYFYEDFLETFDPEARKRHGVFFTPVPVVRYMVAATDRVLRDSLSTDGLLDPKVLLLDPACGTGTFLIAALDAALARVRATLGESLVMHEAVALAERLHGFEFLVGPYTVAHYRLLRAVTAAGATPRARLPIYLADTLAPPAQALHVTSNLGFMAAPILKERQEADALKQATPIIAIIGNPPYRRLSEGEEDAILGGWDNRLWDDLKAPVSEAGWGGELNTFPDLYIAFWRWCIWKLFESDGATGRGVLCLITNRTFLTGHPYAGLRQMLRRRFERIDIIDLRGDGRGARPAGITKDENVFSILAGVCIVVAVAPRADRTPKRDAAVRYADVWRAGAFSAADKESLLKRATDDAEVLTFAQVERHGLDDFTPVPFAGTDWPALPSLFHRSKSGSKSQRDPLVYALSHAALAVQLSAFLSAPEQEAREMFFPRRAASQAPPTAGELRRFAAARKAAFQAANMRLCAYRPLDNRWLYSSPAFVSRHGPELNSLWGAANVGLYAMPSGTGAGPAVWVHGLLPDYHAFTGRGGYAFPLWDRRLGGDTTNLTPALLAGLAAAYGRTVMPQEAFDAIIALLSATSYTQRFAWDLEETFARIPFPASAETFSRAVRIGADIRSLETFARAPAANFKTAQIIGRATCLVPGYDGATLTREGEEALWQQFCTAAPERRRVFEPSSKGRKKAPGPSRHATS